MVDFNAAGNLLHVMEKALPYPQLKWLHDAAMAEVQKLKDPETNPRPVDTIQEGKIPLDPTNANISFRRVPTGGDMPETFQEGIADE